MELDETVYSHTSFISSADIRQIQDDITREKLRILYKNLPIGIGAALICATVVYFGLRNYANIPYLTAWYYVFIVVSMIRTGIIFFYRFFPHLVMANFALFIIGTILASGCWGAIDSFLMPINDPVSQMIIIIIISGVSAGAIQTLQASLVSTITFLSVNLVPLCIWIFVQKEHNFFAVGVAMVTYLIFTTISAIRANYLLTQALKLYFTNKVLVDNLSTSNKVLHHRNNQLEQHEKEMALINNMNKTLQLCQNLKEAYETIRAAAESLFVGCQGGLTINDGRSGQQLIVSWGPSKILQNHFESNECWGIRSGTTYKVKDNHSDVHCKHYDVNVKGKTVCIPMMVHSGIVGLINFNFPSDVPITKRMNQIMTAFSDAAKLALANIKLHETLNEEATHDPLTGLYNRRYLNESLERELHRAVRESTALCVAIIDVDYFKIFNDKYGHEAGDEVLKSIARLLTHQMRGGDIASRFGGEEFVLVFHNTDIPKVLDRIEHLREEVKKIKIYFHNEPLENVTVSIGIAQAPIQGSTVDDIIFSADEALYKAKRNGRNQVIVAE